MAVRRWLLPDEDKEKHLLVHVVVVLPNTVDESGYVNTGVANTQESSGGRGNVKGEELVKTIKTP